ncbi:MULTISPECIES: cysteine desulfurase [unclassified Mucilaginibacter]|uniref:cysteine desulfurase n=1 Tax=unclassified Mucilaginibacter TaxID=2617802 RepID=UPI002AC8C4AA|nr:MULTISPECIES: cysteine desulfurase [unclassified Mucilaginibacter]MEB0260071.1 cysteine desulfurase [Mucilaginibacter sp. 10I4]MEB0280575.1 cysteine desulfurase [Mucilaginibacter sp. 10B2]MEB0301085.1 cysteine desulfurase [Mucilaginibacter sp. 5C4]WPX22392.1 cysteine desulfurase [Mucilaginibacter sp. 5C4]
MTQKKHIEKKALFDVQKIRKDFPILLRTMNGKPLIYFDNGATTQKPKQVIDAIVKYYTGQNANIHRGVHRLSQDATDEYENARVTIQKHIGAKHEHEIIFTRGTTESINLVATAFGKNFVNAGDEIIVSEMEHHSNILPWQQLCEEKNAVLKVIPMTDNGELRMDEYKKLLSAKTKLVAIVHVSNTLGTVNPVKDIISMAHAKNIPVLVDGAQSISHMMVDVQDLDADFYCFSGHKVYAPTGVGILYGKEAWLKKLPNYQVGGGTIKTVCFDKTEYEGSPLRFEAGTPNIEGGIGLAVALDYINDLGLENIAAYEEELLAYATEKISAIEGLRIIGTAKEKVSVLSFVVKGIHPLDIGMLLDAQGIAVRTGHHCTQPLVAHYQIPGTVRASFSFYNTKEEIDVFVNAIIKSIKRISK